MNKQVILRSWVAHLVSKRRQTNARTRVLLLCRWKAIFVACWRQVWLQLCLEPKKKMREKFVISPSYVLSSMATLFEKQNPTEPLNSLTKHNENSVWPQLDYPNIIFPARYCLDRGNKLARQQHAQFNNQLSAIVFTFSCFWIAETDHKFQQNLPTKSSCSGLISCSKLMFING